MSDYFCLGNVAIDDLVFADGSTQWAVPGGAAVYAALGAALWTGGAAVIGPLGGEYPHATLATIDFSGCRRVPTTMRNWGLYEADGSRHFLSRRDSLPWEAFSPAVSDLGAGPYAFCHIAPLPWRRVRELIGALRARGTRLISLDLHDRELAAIQFDELATLLRAVSIFLPSRQDADVLVPGAAPREALRALRERLPALPVIGVKCGADGVLVHAAGAAQVVVVPAYTHTVVDATGAGDAFCGGFLTGFAATGDVVEAALRGTVSASFAVAAVGPAALSEASPSAAAARLAELRARITSEPW